MSQYPENLQKIIDFFQMLPPAEIRAALISYSEKVKKHLPPADVEIDFESIRKDAECEDKVGIFLKFAENGAVTFFIETGPNVQTLTNALACILCEGLSGEKPETIQELPADFVPKIVGGQLFRQRSQTVYYVLRRMKEALKAYENQGRRAEIEADKAAAAEASTEGS